MGNAIEPKLLPVFMIQLLNQNLFLDLTSLGTQLNVTVELQIFILNMFIVKLDFVWSPNFFHFRNLIMMSMHECAISHLMRTHATQYCMIANEHVKLIFSWEIAKLTITFTFLP